MKLVSTKRTKKSSKRAGGSTAVQQPKSLSTRDTEKPTQKKKSEKIEALYAIIHGAAGSDEEEGGGKSPASALEKFPIQALWNDKMTDTHKTLAERYGDPFITKREGEVVDWDTHYWAARYALENLVMYIPVESQFYQYIDTDGTWCAMRHEDLLDDIARYLLKLSKMAKEPILMKKRGPGKLGEMIKCLKKMAKRFEAFPEQKQGVLHLADCMLHIDGSGVQKHLFSYTYFSRQKSTFSYDSTATCSRFLNELVLAAMDQQDAEMLQHFCGQFLLGRNLFQVFLVLSGAARSGKGTIVRIIQEIVGCSKIKELRTQHLAGRFELDDLSKATLLLGSDVSEDFLSNQGAAVIKKITGGDTVASEKKGGDKGYQKADHNVLIATNSKLLVKLQGDVSAWKRRMHIIEFARAHSGPPIVNFDKILIAEEASGILNWFITGAQKILALCQEGSDFPATTEQRARVEALLHASESIDYFVEKGLGLREDHDVTSDELFEGYELFCTNRGWKSESKGRFLRDLPLKIKRHYNLVRSHDIKRDGKPLRGYRRLALNPSTGASSGDLKNSGA
ncbi:DUF5906 domain-containing protein [Prosthecobacter vanneervenii]|uniref:P4 family phage/plasmid primase-like protein n=1 Tax=Prosthecobacter vanneervenii TaxID=48466 RepID=A0A7W7Y6J8_9BACT|nr:DUF5906 domain-containing protein [Prosthecobacter vanneervenii]MBB5030517.1 P4 family phage/plasmid primase-like protein [Prosthecobacter vanneervenii]